MTIRTPDRTYEPYTEAEQTYDKIVKSCILKSGPHVPAPTSEEVLKNGGKKLFTVTTFAASPRYGGTRTVTVCDSFERAQEIIEKNIGDIFECSYRLAMIDTIIAGWLYYCPDEEYWYLWVDSGDTGSYKPIEKPEAYANVVGMGGVG